MDNATIAVVIAGAALLLNLVQRLFGGGYNFSKNLSAMELRLKAEIKASEKEIEQRQDIAAHDFGETVAALKEHVRQFEFYVRDKYIQKDDFVVHMKSHDDLLRLNFANITSRLERIEKQLDQK